MESSPPNESWEQILAAQEELDQDVVALPRLIDRADGSIRRASPRAVRFAEALAFADAWSGISEARQQRRDLAA